MGNGVGKLPAEALESPLSTFRYLETLCKQGYFIENPTDYEVAVREAIRMGQLDILEILLASGNVKNLQHYPLHTAIQHGQIDVLELLVSAGFDVAYTSNLEQGMTSLHVAANIRGNKLAASCAAYIACRGGVRLAKFRTSEGYTAFHMAALKGNVMFLEHVLPCYSQSDITQILKMPSREGHLARALAHERGDRDVTSLMDAYTYGTTAASGNTNPRAATGPVNEARMMQVWEAFFENAMKRMISMESNGCELLMVDPDGMSTAMNNVRGHSMNVAKDVPLDRWEWGDDRSSGGGTLTDSEPAAPGSRYRSQYNIRKNGSSSSIEATFDRGNGLGSSSVISKLNDKKIIEQEIQSLVMHWFAPCLVYDSSSGTDQYYMLNRSGNGESMWLAQWLYETYHRYNQNSVQPTPTKLQLAEITNARLPRMVIEAIKLGWVTYFDRVSNSCMWLNVHSWAVQWVLPLGGDPLLAATGIRSEASVEEEDIAADQSIAENWVMVVTEYEKDKAVVTLPAKMNEVKLDSKSFGNNSNKVPNEDNDIWSEWDADVLRSEQQNDPYYYNRITGDTSLDAPPNYHEINEKRGGWALICSEQSDWAYYWFHEGTSESVWCEVA
jgi:hypothetical protein